MYTKALLCLMFVLGVALVGSGCAAPLAIQAVKKVKKSTDSEEKDQPEQKQQSPQKQE